MANAQVSHELRNPLNSIIAKNIQISHLTEELRQELAKADVDRAACQNIVEKLGKSNKNQENSATIMLFMVQDLLDMAQIKSKKFRKNIKYFNLKEAIETILEI